VSEKEGKGGKRGKGLNQKANCEKDEEKQWRERKKELYIPLCPFLSSN